MIIEVFLSQYCYCSILKIKICSGFLMTARRLTVGPHQLPSAFPGRCPLSDMDSAVLKSHYMMV